MIIYSIDIGGSSIKHAIIDTHEKDKFILIGFKSIKLNSNKFADLKELLIGAVKKTINLHKEIEAIAICTTGSVDLDGTVVNAGHFDGYSNISWKDILNESIGSTLKVFTISDGKASTWAEYSSSDGAKTHVHFVIGTGIGGSIVINNRIYNGDENYAGYLGHLKVHNNRNTICSCGKFGCVETVASGPAIVRYFMENSIDIIDSKISLGDVLIDAQKGNKIALEAIYEAGINLGIAISYVLNILNPSMITIGGGVISALKEYKIQDYYLDAVTSSAKENSHKRVLLKSKIRFAKFDNNSGLIGAAKLLEIDFNKIQEQ